MGFCLNVLLEVFNKSIMSLEEEKEEEEKEREEGRLER